MDYLKSFVIGSSGLAFVQHLLLLSLAPKSLYTYDYKTYSFILPLYYGLMNMLATYLGKRYNLDLRQRLLLTSIISIIFIFLLNYFYSRHHYKPYQDFSRNEWVSYLIKNGARHLVNFNIIIYYLEKYFPVSYPLRLFVIGSSVFSFLITYFKVAYVDQLGIPNYKYETFAPAEPFIQGIDFLVTVLLLHNVLGFSLPMTLFLWATLGSVLWLLLAYGYQTYTYQGMGWLWAFLRVVATGLFKSYILYYLVTWLK